MAGFATWAGIATGTYCHALAVAFGLSKLFIAIPIAYDVSRYLGAAYLLYLSWRVFSAKDAQFSPKGDVKVLSARDMFRQGLYTNLLNPKMVAFVLALFPQFIDPQMGFVVLQCLVFATIHNLIGLSVNGAVILTSSSIGSFLSSNRTFRNTSRYFLGTVFAGLAIRLAVDNKQ